MDDAAERDQKEPEDSLALLAEPVDGLPSPAPLLNKQDDTDEYSPSIAPDPLERGLDRPDGDGPAPSHAGVVDPPEAPADQAHTDFDDEMTLYELAQHRPGVPAAPVCPMEAPADGVGDGAVEHLPNHEHSRTIHYPLLLTNIAI